VRLLVATTNPGKLREIGPMLSGLDIELLTLADLPAIEAPEETGSTFEANARLKAIYYASRTGQLTVAEDSGIEIDPMGGAPGVESARFGGAGSTYPEKFALIYEALSGRPEPWTARFVCAVSLVRGNDVLYEARGTVEGTIAREPRGTGGFGYDPIFFYPPFGCTLAEAGERKAEVSHRARAFAQLRDFLRSAGTSYDVKSESARHRRS
jgi:XTP/dITP diphosphohydrolase